MSNDKPVILSFDDFDEMEQNVHDMTYHLDSDFDTWYPTKADVDQCIARHDIQAVRFLLWCLDVRTNTSKAVQDMMHYIRKALYREDFLKLEDA